MEPPGDDKLCEHAHFYIYYLHKDHALEHTKMVIEREPSTAVQRCTFSAFGGSLALLKARQVVLTNRPLYHRNMHRIVKQHR